MLKGKCCRVHNGVNVSGSVDCRNTQLGNCHGHTPRLISSGQAVCRNALSGASRNSAYFTRALRNFKQFSGVVSNRHPACQCVSTDTLAATTSVQNEQPPTAAAPAPRVSATSAAIGTYLQNAVKVFSTFSRPNWGLPWQRQRQESSNLSGFILDPSTRLLVTSAYYLQYSSRVQVKKSSDDARYTARILCMSVNTDTAVLTVDDDAFWEGTQPLISGPLPELREKVAVVGYPVGGLSVSVTEGVVSRVEMTNCRHLYEYILGMQIDAAINRGNEGSLVLNSRGQLIGMAAYSLPGDTENIGYVIPTAALQHVVQDYLQHGGLQGHPSLGVEYQGVESPALREMLGLEGSMQGVLVRRVTPTAPSAAVLRPFDVITSVDGVPIAGDGTVAFRIGERINWTHMVKQKYPGDELVLGVLRDRQPMTVTVTLNAPATSALLVPQHIEDKDPPYLLVGGLLFTICTGPYLRWEYGTDVRGRAPVRLVEQYFYDTKKEAGQEVVLLSQVIACHSTSGYESIGRDLQLLKACGTPVRSLRHLAELVAACRDRHLTFEFDMGFLVVLQREDAVQDTEMVMTRHGVPYAASEDIREHWVGSGHVWPPSEEQEPVEAA